MTCFRSLLRLIWWSLADRLVLLQCACWGVNYWGTEAGRRDNAWKATTGTKRTVQAQGGWMVCSNTYYIILKSYYFPLKTYSNCKPSTFSFFSVGMHVYSLLARSLVNLMARTKTQKVTFSESENSLVNQETKNRQRSLNRSAYTEFTECKILCHMVDIFHRI